MVYWIEPLTLNQRVPGSIPVNARHFLSFSKALYPHCCSPPRCINGYPVWVPGRMRTVRHASHLITLLFSSSLGIVCACKTATGRNAPQGVEEVHSECRIVPESYDRGNNTL